MELPVLASRLQEKRLESLSQARASLIERIEALCEQLPVGHPSRTAYLESGGAGAYSAGAHGLESDAAKSLLADGDDGKGGMGRTRLAGGPEMTPESELEDSWAVIAEEEDRNSRRASVGGTLNKMLAVVAKHKWAYPFKRPVTDKEAPDYKDVITNPMDCACTTDSLMHAIWHAPFGRKGQRALVLGSASPCHMANTPLCCQTAPQSRP